MYSRVSNPTNGRAFCCILKPRAKTMDSYNHLLTAHSRRSSGSAAANKARAAATLSPRCPAARRDEFGRPELAEARHPSLSCLFTARVIRYTVTTMPRPSRDSYGDSKPPYSYIALTAMALYHSPERNRIYRQYTQ